MRAVRFFKKLNFFSFFALFFVCAFFFSCSNASQVEDIFDETDTLRYTAEKLYSATSWTESVETDRLTANISSVKGISNKLSLNPLTVSAAASSSENLIFPSYGSFGSLDTSLIPKSLKEMLISFCESISKNRDCDSYFKKENLYTLALFYVDFNRIFKNLLDLEPKQEQKSPENSSDSSEKSEESLPEQKNEVVFFSKYMIGEPFLDGIYYEVPVRLSNEKSWISLSLFCFEDSGQWKIDQIQISDWEIF